MTLGVVRLLPQWPPSIMLTSVDSGLVPKSLVSSGLLAQSHLEVKCLRLMP